MGTRWRLGFGQIVPGTARYGPGSATASRNSLTSASGSPSTNKVVAEGNALPSRRKNSALSTRPLSSQWGPSSRYGSSAKGSPRLREIHPDALVLGVRVHGDGAELAAPAGRLVAAERERRVVHVVGVDPDGAGLEAVRDLHRALDVLRPDRGREAVEGPVARRDRV